MKRADLARVDSAWTVTVDADARLEQVAEALCSLADGRFGTRGGPRGGRHRLDAAGPGRRRLPRRRGRWTDAATRPGLDGAGGGDPRGPGPPRARLHGGVLRRAWTTADGAAVHSLRFVSLTRPGVVGLRAEGPPGVLCAGPALLAPGNGPASRRAAAATSSGPAPGPPAGAASPPPPASTAATTAPCR